VFVLGKSYPGGSCPRFRVFEKMIDLWKGKCGRHTSPLVSR
jgi:hypothetical protein